MCRDQLRVLSAPYAKAQAEEDVHSHDGPGAHFGSERAVISHLALGRGLLKARGNAGGGRLIVGAEAGRIDKFRLVDDPVNLFMIEDEPQIGSQCPSLAIQSVYLKDCSYEATKCPRVEGASWNPQISLDINTTANVISPELNEVVLTVTVGAKQGETTAFLVELKHAGLFVMRGLSAEDMRRAIGTICPNVLFPYARVAVSSLVTQGGFPNFVLPPVDFNELFARGVAQQQAQAAQGQAN